MGRDKQGCGLPINDGERKALPLFTFLTQYFPLAFIEVCRVAVTGNKQHNPGEPLHWAREKSTDQLNTALRHMVDHGMGNVFDVDGCYHLAKAIWRLSAELQLQVERDNGAMGDQRQGAGTEGSGEDNRPHLPHAEGGRGPGEILDIPGTETEADGEGSPGPGDEGAST